MCSKTLLVSAVSMLKAAWSLSMHKANSPLGSTGGTRVTVMKSLGSHCSQESGATESATGTLPSLGSRTLLRGNQGVMSGNSWSLEERIPNREHL